MGTAPISLHGDDACIADACIADACVDDDHLRPRFMPKGHRLDLEQIQTGLW